MILRSGGGALCTGSTGTTPTGGGGGTSGEAGALRTSGEAGAPGTTPSCSMISNPNVHHLELHILIYISSSLLCFLVARYRM